MHSEDVRAIVPTQGDLSVLHYRIFDVEGRRMRDLISAIRAQLSATNFCPWCDLAAAEAWHRIRYAHSLPKTSLFETTMTQNLLMAIAMHPAPGVRVFEALDESRNGNDLEILIEVASSSYACYAVQAKIVYRRTGRYQQIRHQTRNGQQIDLLLAYAAREKCVPGYLLYCHSESLGPQRGAKVTLTQSGIHFLHAVFVHKHCFANGSWQRHLTPADSMPNGITFRELMCEPALFDAMDGPEKARTRVLLKDILPSALEPLPYELAFKAESYAADSTNWAPITELDHSGQPQSGSDGEFAPRYRIVVRAE